eukprot:scaffold182414_cov30-Attheya_sp.AAC.2
MVKTRQSSNDQGGRSVRRSAVVRQAVRVATEWATHVLSSERSKERAIERTIQSYVCGITQPSWYKSPIEKFTINFNLNFVACGRLFCGSQYWKTERPLSSNVLFRTDILMGPITPIRAPTHAKQYHGQWDSTNKKRKHKAAHNGCWSVAVLVIQQPPIEPRPFHMATTH